MALIHRSNFRDTLANIPRTGATSDPLIRRAAGPDLGPPGVDPRHGLPPLPGDPNEPTQPSDVDQHPAVVALKSLILVRRDIERQEQMIAPAREAADAALARFLDAAASLNIGKPG